MATGGTTPVVPVAGESAGPAQAVGSAPTPWTPARAMLVQRCTELRRHPPFAQMREADVETFVAAAQERYHPPGEAVVEPAHGVARWLCLIRRGAVRGERPGGGPGDTFRLDAGELFPIGAVLGERPVTSRYIAQDDVFCLAVEAGVVQRLVQASPPFAAFLQHRVQQLLRLSTQALGAAASAQALAEQSMEAPLASLGRRLPVACAPDTPLAAALRLMHERRVGSIVALGPAGSVEGILTRHDVLERVALARPADTLPIIEVMTRPVRTLPESASIHDAALVMSRHGIRHVPIVDADARMVSIVSERDLFALARRHSLQRVSSAVRAAHDADELIAAAAGIRGLAEHLLRQGLAARTLTGLVSHLNDLVAERAVALVAASQGVEPHRFCWLAFGSEGRGEQTIATDQDNGLVFVPQADAEAERPAWLRFGASVNQLLDAAGYPLCQGGVMAGNAPCCLSQPEWLARFDRWFDRAQPEDLLAASIFFDLRVVAGDVTLAEPLQRHVAARAPQARRFLRALAENSLTLGPGLDWLGGLDTEADGDHRWLDLKLRGTAPMVDAARLFALAQGVLATSTRERLQAVATALALPPAELEGYLGAFEALQLLRLRVQCTPPADAPRHGSANRVDVASLGDLDRRVLKEAMHAVRRLQQRLQLEFVR